jgi:hypothetical protein
MDVDVTYQQKPFRVVLNVQSVNGKEYESNKERKAD